MSSFKSITKSDKFNNYIELAIVILLMGIASFIFLLSSPLHPWISSEANIDSSVFKTVAMMMDKGYMPYRDSFDHKGPVLYILEWIGYKIAPYCGTWIIEFIFMVTFIFMCYRISRLVTGKVISCVVALTTLSILGKYFSRGDFTEEYALAFSSISLFIFIDYFLNGIINKKRLIILGACFAATFLLRPNLIAVWPAFILVILIQSIINKDWNKLVNYILWFIIGVVIVALPIIIWFVANGSLQYAYDAFISFNFEYSSSSGGRASTMEKLYTLMELVKQPVSYISLITTILLCFLQKDKNKRLLSIAFLIYILINLAFTCIAGNSHEHYRIILVPEIAYPLPALLMVVQDYTGNISINKLDKLINPIIITVASIVLMVIFIIPAFKDNVLSLPKAYRDRNNVHFSELTYEIKDVICRLTDKNDTISVYGNFDFIYLICDRKHATRYSYQFPISDIQPSILDEYFSQLGNELPKVIVVVDMYLDDQISNFLSDNNYQSVYELPGLVTIYSY